MMIKRFFAALAFGSLSILAMPVALLAEDRLISPVQAHSQAKSGKLMIIDVRTPEEWKRSGIPIGAKGATIRRRDGRKNLLERIRLLTNGDKTARIAMICATGVRSAHATTLLRRHGYVNVKDIKGGMLGNSRDKGWLKSKLPVDIVD